MTHVFWSRWSLAVGLAICATVAVWGQDSPASSSYSAIPSVTGKRITVAEQILRLAELKCARGVFFIAPRNWRAEIRPEVVYMQTPQPKGIAKHSTTVACWTFAKAAKDQRLLEMPDLRQMPVAAAMTIIKQHKLRLMTDLPKTSGDEEWQIRDQYPTAGQTVYETTSIHLVLQEAK